MIVKQLELFNLQFTLIITSLPVHSVVSVHSVQTRLFLEGCFRKVASYRLCFEGLEGEHPHRGESGRRVDRQTERVLPAASKLIEKRERWWGERERERERIASDGEKFLDTYLKKERRGGNLSKWGYDQV